MVNTTLMLALEELVDSHSLCEVLDALSEVCGEKQEHLLSNWQDVNASRAWGVASFKVAELAHSSAVLKVS